MTHLSVKSSHIFTTGDQHVAKVDMLRSGPHWSMSGDDNGLVGDAFERSRELRIT